MPSFYRPLVVRISGHNGVTLRRYQELNTLRADLEVRAELALVANADFAHLKTLPGIGSVLAMTILAEGGNLRRFAHHRQFLKYCGFDLGKNQSDIQRGKEQLSKRGNARLRLAFWLAAVAAVRMRENSFRAKYQRYIHATPDDADLRRKALTAVAAKMARVAYGMIKKKQPYRQFFEQIPLLFEFFVSEAAIAYDRPHRAVDAKEYLALMTHAWPGNVRELKNAAERFILATRETGTRFLMNSLHGPPAPIVDSDLSLHRQVEEVERRLIVIALKKSDGDIRTAINLLKVPRRTLNEKMVRYKIDRRDFAVAASSSKTRSV